MKCARSYALSGLSVSGQTELANASVTTSNSYDSEAMKRNLERHLAIYDHSGEMPWTVCNGSGVLIWAWVANGWTDALLTQTYWSVRRVLWLNCRPFLQLAHLTKVF